MEKTDKPRILYLDAARCAAILLIALNHAVNRSWVNYGAVTEEFHSISLPSTILKALLTVASRYGVPLFLMITGALILRKRFETAEDVRRFYRHNWLSLLITSEIWFFLGFWFQVLVNPGNHMLAELGLGETLRACLKTLLFLDQVRFDSMWYVPMILSVYLVLPIFAVLLRHTALRRVLILPAALLLWTAMLLPVINDYRSMFGLNVLSNYLYYSNFFSEYLLYILAGWWVAEGGLRKLTDRTVIGAALLCYLLCTALQFWCYSSSDHLIDYDSPAILLSAILAFECLRRYADRLRRWERPITAVSRAAFALYLLHVFFLWPIHWYCDLSAWSRPAKVLMFELVPLGLSGLLIWPLSKIPFCRKYLFLIK